MPDMRDKKTGELLHSDGPSAEDRLIVAVEMLLRELRAGRKTAGHRTSINTDMVNHKVLGIRIDVTFKP